ncbi:MAG TPA: hypothetical protein VMM78_03105 [Thermomicrobiales bacterium]|nr:hypothetical protein [Thermomicrobiales bacterium]
MKILAMALALVLALTAVACGGDDEPVAIADATNCEQVMDAFIPLMQEILDSMSDLTMADLMSDDTPEPLLDFEERMEEIGAKAEDLDCSDDEMASMLEDRVDELEAEGPVAEFVLEILKEGDFD